MLIIPPFRIAHHEKKPASTGPALVSAVADFDASTLTLTFDRAVAVAGDNVEQIAIIDAVTHRKYASGAGFYQSGADQITLNLDDVGAYTGTHSWMNAGAMNNIYATADGARWIGVVNYSL